MKPTSLPPEDFTYNLPDDCIAQFPLEERDRSRLLVMRSGTIEEGYFFQLPEFLPAGCTLVRNDTRVIHARLLFRKESGARIEIFCLEPVAPHTEINLALQTPGSCIWKCLVGNAAKWKDGPLIMEFQSGSEPIRLVAERKDRIDGAFHIHFHWDPAILSWASMLESAGHIPLPPYIQREATGDDELRYQTVFARNEGSVAAPTAGLHFSEAVNIALRKKGIGFADLSLHVGAGTFKPVTAARIEDHHMHAEPFVIARDTLQQLISAKGPLVSVGTTSLRTLESLYWLGVRLIAGKESASGFMLEQWDAYEEGLPQDLPCAEAFQALSDHMDRHGLSVLSGQTRLMIVPAYRIRTATHLITNFHQPHSTLLLLVAAFAGPDWRKAYEYALDRGFRFLSYGDACLFSRV